jgi:hypothetical protein
MALLRNDELKVFFNRKIPMLRVHVFSDYHCSCGNASCATPGKHPAESRGVHSARVVCSDVFGKYNVGVACGNGICVLDIDPRNGGDKALASLIEKHGELPKTWTVATGGGGTHYYFAVDGEQKSGKNLKGIDLIGMGGYVLAPTSLHPSGRVYEWDVSPDDVPLAKLPKWVVDECCSDGKPVEHGATAAESIYDLEDVKGAIASLDPDCCREQWVRVGMSLKSGGYAFELWNEWSARSGKKYPGFVEMQKQWNSFRTGGGIGIGTLFFYAEQNGWKPREVEKWDWKKEIVEAETFVDEQKKEEAIDVELPPGVLGDLAKVFLASALHKHPKFAIASSLLTASALAQGNYCTPVHGGRLGLYYLLTAGASAGKEFYGSRPLDIVRSVDARRVMGVPMSSQAIRAELNSCNSRIFYLDEGLRWLSLKVESRQPNDKMVIDDLLQIWGGSRRILEGYSTKRDADKTPPVTNPLLSVIACGTTEKLTTLLRKNLEFIEDGLMSRFDYVISDYVSDVDFLSTRKFEVPDHVYEALSALAIGFEEKRSRKPVEGRGGSQDAQVVKTVQFTSSVPVAWESEQIARRWANLAAEWNGKARGGDSLTASIWNRAAEKVVRVSSVLAACDNAAEPVITSEMLEWAISWQRMLATTVVKMVEDRAGESRDAELQKVLLERLVAAGGQATLAKLQKHDRRIRNASKRELEDAIAVLIMSGEIDHKAGMNRGKSFLTLTLAKDFTAR